MSKLKKTKAENSEHKNL